jgi:hypothetical protein
LLGTTRFGNSGCALAKTSLCSAGKIRVAQVLKKVQFQFDESDERLDLLTSVVKYVEKDQAASPTSRF